MPCHPHCNIFFLYIQGKSKSVDAQYFASDWEVVQLFQKEERARREMLTAEQESFGMFLSLNKPQIHLWLETYHFSPAHPGMCVTDSILSWFLVRKYI